MAKKRPTIAEIRANRGRHQYTMMRVENWEELAAAEAAGIDMVSVPPEMLLEKQFRAVAPTLFAVPGMALYSAPAATDDYLRWAFRMMEAGADAVYCAASFQTVRRMADESIPVIGHVGLIPHFCTWTGGFRAVGKTADSAMAVYERCKAYEQAGAFGVEIEVVPPEVTAEIAKRTSLFLVSMGGGCRRGLPVSLRLRRPGHEHRPRAAPRQEIRRPRRGIRPPATDARRCVQSLRGGRAKWRLSR